MLRTVVVESQTQGAGSLRRSLAAHPAVSIVAELRTLAEALAGAAQHRPDLVIAQIPETQAVAEAVQSVEALARAVPDAALVVAGPALAADAVLQIIRAGALEFLRWPVERDELLAVLDKVSRVRRSAAPARPAGRVLSVYCTKGGLGVTTIATNLAVSLAEQAPGTTVLIDLDTRQSDIATFLNLTPGYSVIDALENLDRLDESFLRGLLVKHPTGLLVLPGPARMEQRGHLGTEQVRALLDVARSHFAHVVVDLRHDLDPGTIAALEASEHVLFLTSLDVCALRSGAAGLTAFRHLGLPMQKVKVIVMREDTGEDVTLKNARDILGVPVFWKTPSDYRTVVAAINSGEPVVTASPRSRIAKNLRQLAGALDRGAEAPGARAASVVRLVWNLKNKVAEG